MGRGFVLSIRFCHTFKDRTANGKKYSDVSLDQQLIARFKKKGLTFRQSIDYETAVCIPHLCLLRRRQ